MILENFKNGYEVSNGSLLAKSEKNDCLVRAFANALNVTYDVAHKFTAEKFERKFRKGAKMTMDKLSKLGKVSFELFKDSSVQFINRFPDPGNQCVVFIDPPFSSNEYELILNKLNVLPSIRVGSLIVVESNQTREILFPESLLLLKHRNYGSVKIDILLKQ